MTDARACVVESMNDLGTKVEDVHLRMCDMIAKLPTDLATLIRTGPRAAGKKLVSVLVVGQPRHCVR